MHSLFAIAVFGAASVPTSAQDETALSTGTVAPPLDIRAETPPLLPAITAEPETADVVETDRNAFTFSRFTVGRGRRVVESSYSFIDIGDEGAKQSFPETMIRAGLTDRFEARLGYNFETGAENAEGDVVSSFGIDAPQQAFYGFKYELTRRDLPYRLMPDVAFLLQGHSPIGYSLGQTQIRTGFSWGWLLPNDWELEQSLRFGTDRRGDDDYTLWAPSSLLKIPFGARKQYFTQVEYFGIMTDGRARDFSKQFVSTGLHYLATPNFEIGGYVGFGINDQTRGVMLNVGIGYRF